ncbi:MAG: phosphonoacetaldehyde reductase [Immundisolibacteraceae bacterium]|nr:phosphonoacetaldehyde reductase [Immundisolibacteraceae bacterium]
MTAFPLNSEISAANQLHAKLEHLSARRVFLVTGKESFFASKAAETIATACDNLITNRFCDFAANPERTDVNLGIAQCTAFSPDVIVAIGGGSVIDMAKLISAAMSSVRDDINDILLIDKISREIPLIAVPTTAGSGSEATQFAVLYIEKTKHSVDAPALLPDYSILDSRLTLSASSFQSAVSGIDALCQSIESFWSVQSTTQSRKFSTRAIELILANIGRSVNQADPDARRQMLTAAHLAGQAINITRTTGPHALSYILTSAFGVPHGQAVALSVVPFFNFNADYNNHKLNDPRGHNHLQTTFKTLVKLFNITQPADFSKKFHALLTSIGLQSSLRQLGIEGEKAIQLIADNVNLERLKNNPVTISSTDIHQIISAMLDNPYFD